MSNGDGGQLWRDFGKVVANQQKYSDFCWKAQNRQTNSLKDNSLILELFQFFRWRWHRDVAGFLDQHYSNRS